MRPLVSLQSYPLLHEKSEVSAGPHRVCDSPTVYGDVVGAVLTVVGKCHIVGTAIGDHLPAIRSKSSGTDF